MTLLTIIGLIIWLAAVVSLCSRRDIEIHSKLTWVVTVLILNILGAIIYFIFGPRHAPEPEDKEVEIDPDAKPFVPPGVSWNPILGENRLPSGQGLNPKSEPAPDDPAAQP